MVGSSRGFSCVEPDSNRRVLRCLFCFTVTVSLDGDVGSGRPQADGLAETCEAIEDRLEPRAGDRAEHESPSPESKDSESDIFRRSVSLPALHG
jgi:hypothetical protein